MRTSSPDVAGNFIRGARSQGCGVVDVGVVGTDVLYYAVASLDLDGGAIITASHNPKEYNGIKMVRRGALALSGDAGIKEIRHALLAGRFAERAFDLLNAYGGAGTSRWTVRMTPARRASSRTLNTHGLFGSTATCCTRAPASTASRPFAPSTPPPGGSCAATTS